MDYSSKILIASNKGRILIKRAIWSLFQWCELAGNCQLPDIFLKKVATQEETDTILYTFRC